MERRWYKAPEVAAYLSLSSKTVYDLCSRGLLPCAKIKGIGLRIDIQKVDELIENQTIITVREQLREKD